MTPESTPRPPSNADEYPGLLFGGIEAGEPLESASPEFLTDLNLNGILDAIAAEQPGSAIKPLLLTRLHKIETIEYRQAVFRDMAQPAVVDAFEAFTSGFGRMRELLGLASELRFALQGQRHFLEATIVYCESTARLAHDLGELSPDSAGLLALRRWLGPYITRAPFRVLRDAAFALRRALDEVRYTLTIQGNRIAAARYTDEPDAMPDVLHALQNFFRSKSQPPSFEFRAPRAMNHVEEAVLTMVSQLHPGLFAELAEHQARHANFVDPVLARLDQEAQFYLAVTQHARRHENRGLPFCLPTVAHRPGDTYAREAFDLGLADMLLPRGALPVRNDFELRNAERMLVVSGPNQGGKTTFARMFGQLHYLAVLGCPVPAAEARLPMWDRMLTHFEREESALDPRGKLEQDLIRLHEMLESATPASVLILNEILSALAWRDGLHIGQEVLRQIAGIGCCGVLVTFHDELAGLDRTTVSMVAQVDPHDPARRTFRVVRAPASGLAYAAAIAQKHRLTYSEVKLRLTHERTPDASGR